MDRLRKLLTAILLMFLTFSAFSQALKLGIQGSLDVSSFLINGNESWSDHHLEMVPSAQVSMNGYLGYFVHPRLVIAVEPGIKKMGGVVLSDHHHSVLFRLNYVHLPLTFDYHISEKMSLTTGIDFSHLNTRRELSRTEQPKVSGNYNRFETSALIGLGYQVGSNIDIGLRYHLGLSRTFDLQILDSGGEVIKVTPVKNKYIQFLVRIFI